MEKYIYYSIIVFSSFIFLLYIYLLFAKLSETYEFRKKTGYEREILPMLESVFSQIENKYPDEETIAALKSIARNKIKRELLIERIVYYTSMFTGKIRENIVKLAGEVGLPSYEIRRLKEKNVFQTAAACKNLGEFRSKAAVQPLLNQISSRSADVKYHAMMALAKIGDPDSFIKAFELLEEDELLSDRSLTEIVDSFEGDKEQLYNRMINSDNIYSSIIFIKSMGNYMDAKLSAKAMNFINDQVKERKIAAIKAVGQSADVRFFKQITERLKDEEWEVRAAAAKSLGKIQDSRALPYLMASLTDSQWWVRYNSAKAIINIPGGTDLIEQVFEGEDKFAKDIMISALEDSGIINDLYLYEFSGDESKSKLSGIIKKYILEG